jgi:hypothetical protein
MKPRSISAAALMLAISGGTALSAYAGTVMVTERKDSNGVNTQTMQVQSGNLRMSELGKNDNTSFVMAGKTMYIIDDEKKSYHVLDEAAMKRMGDRMAQAREQMQAQMASMPPEQRAMMEKMMGRAAAPSAPPPVTRSDYRRTTRSESAAGVSCKVWEGYENGKKTEEICVAPVGSIPGGGEFIAALKQMAINMDAFTKSLGGNARHRMENAWSQLDSIGGLPIISRDFDGGKVTSTMTMKSIKSASLPAATFSPPAGYKMEAMDMGDDEGHGRHHRH